MKNRFIQIVIVLLLLLTMGACANKTTSDNANNTLTQEETKLDYASKYIDLHLHLDGAITLDIAKKLAYLQGLTLPAESDEELEKLLTVPEDCKSLNDFLECFALPCELMQTKEGLSEAVYLVCENIKSQGVIYAEIRYAPQLHTEKGMSVEDTVLAALDGLSRTDLKANLILCCMRGEGNEALNEETVRVAQKYLKEDGGVVAIDLAGAEAVFKTENYKDLFALASELNIPFTIHAGEADGADSVKLAIEYGAKRIGHGVRSYEDLSVLELIKEKGIYLDMCPTSNIQTCAIDDFTKYPLVDYLNSGIKVTLNTDDMAIEGTTLASEFRLMEKEHGLTPEQEKTLLLNSIEGAFTSREVKDSLIKELGY